MTSSWLQRFVDLILTMDLSYYPVSACSFLAFLIMYKYISPWISNRFCPGYKLLSRSKQIDWNTRTNSTVHALVVSSLCLYTLIVDQQIRDDPIWADSHLVRYSCAVVVGYMIYDVVVVLQHWAELGEIFYFCHHAATIYAYYFVMTYSVLCYFANFRLLAELSTPFVNQRWFLDVLNYEKKSIFFTMNGIAMAVIFFLCRIAVIPSYYYRIYCIYGTEAYVRLGNIQYVLLSSCFVLDTLNVLWLYKIVRGALKLLGYPKPKIKQKVL